MSRKPYEIETKRHETYRFGDVTFISKTGELLDPDGTAPLGWCDPVTAPHQRITLTLPLVLAAEEIILHITGEEKRAVLANAAREGLPIAAVTEQDRNPVSIWWAP